MIAHDCFITASTFEGSQEDSADVFGKKIEDIAIAREAIKKNENKIKRSPSIYDIDIYGGYQYHEIFYSNETELNRDHRKTLQKILDQSTLTDLDDEQTIVAASQETANQVNALITTNNNPPVEEIKCVYSEDSLHCFYKYAISKYPLPAKRFLNGLEMLFHSLAFSDNVESSLNRIHGGLDNFSPIIIDALSCLEDYLINNFDSKTENTA